MARRKSAQKNRAAALKKARALRHAKPLEPVSIRREPCSLQEKSDESPNIMDEPSIDDEILSTDYESSESNSSQSGDDYEEVQSNLLMSLNSLRAIIRHMLCEKCKGMNGDMWPSVTNLKGFKVEITVTCKCGYSFVHEIFEQLDVNKAFIRCLIANGISLEAFQRVLIVMGFTYWSDQRNAYLSVNLSSVTFNSQLENQAIIDAADASEKRCLQAAARKSSLALSFDGTYKTQGYNSRACFGALLMGKQVVASDIVKKEMRPSFKGTSYGNMKSISSNAMECFLVEKLLKEVNPIIGKKIQKIDTDGDARIPKIIPKIQWSEEDSLNINPITKEPLCKSEDVGKTIWNDENGPELRADKVRNNV